MTIFADGRCPVKSCPHNHGDEGVNCGFVSPVEVGAQSLTARASRASRAAVELSPVEARQRAQQLALQLEV